MENILKDINEFSHDFHFFPLGKGCGHLLEQICIASIPKADFLAKRCIEFDAQSSVVKKQKHAMLYRRAHGHSAQVNDRAVALNQRYYCRM